MGLDTPGNVADALTGLLAIGGRMDVVDRIYTTMDQVTAEDVMDAAKTFLTKDKRTVVLVEGR